MITYLKQQQQQKIVFYFQIARDRVGVGDELAMPKFTSLKSIHGSEDGLDRSTLDKNTTLEIAGIGSGGQSISQQQRTNSSVHVCWHRSTTGLFVCLFLWALDSEIQ